MNTDHDRPLGFEHYLMLNLPEAPPRAAGPGRYVRLTLARGPGPDFSEGDRELLTLLRPHLNQAYLDVERRRHPIPQLTARRRDLLRLLAAGHTNAQIARRLSISEGTVRGLSAVADRCCLPLAAAVAVTVAVSRDQESGPRRLVPVPSFAGASPCPPRHRDGTRPLLPPTRLLPNPGTDGFCQGRLRVYMNHASRPGAVVLRAPAVLRGSGSPRYSYGGLGEAAHSSRPHTGGRKPNLTIRHWRLGNWTDHGP